MSVTFILQSAICGSSIGRSVLRRGEVPVEPRPVAAHSLLVQHDLVTLIP